MAINLDAVGRTFGTFSLAYTPRDVMLYALAVGADETELPFLYELQTVARKHTDFGSE